MTSVLCYGIFVSLASVISFQDWRERKIRNNLILIGLGACAAGLLFLLLNSLLGAGHARFWFLGEYYLPLRYYPKLFVHAVLSLIAGVGFWQYSIWPAGDAKFFTLAALFIAVIDPNLPGFPTLLFLVLLINIFVPAGLVFTLETVVKLVLMIPRLRGFNWSKWLKAVAEVAVIRVREVWPHRFEYLILGLNLFALFFIVQVGASKFSQLIQEPWGSLSLFVLMFAFWRVVVIVLRNKLVGLVAVVALASTALVGLARTNWSVWEGFLAAGRMALNFGMLLSLGRVVFSWIIEKDSHRELRVDELKYGDILSDATWTRLSSEKDLAMRMGARYVDGMSESDVAALKAWLESRAASEYSLYQTIPFAFWIFLGALLTLSYRGNVIVALAPYCIRAQEFLCGK